MFREGYSPRHLRADAIAGLVVGIVALPLSMALAIATGAPPQNGLYTAIVAGAVIAVLGGSRCQISGPTAAFVAILLPIVHDHGLAGLMVATVMAGLMQMALGLLRLGRCIQFVPFPVVTGFTAGIAVTIATGQLANLAGLQGVQPQSHFHLVVAELVRAASTLQPFDLLLGLGTVALLIVLPRLLPRVPAPLLAVGLATLAAVLLREAGIATPATIATKFTYTAADGSVQAGIPPWPPRFALPWLQPGPAEQGFVLDFAELRALLMPAITICLLGAIESLLSAVAADGMARTRHDPDAELLAQGTGNVIAPFFGGFAATGAIARTATNIKSGAHSPFSALVHCAFLLAAVLSLAPLLSELPMAALAGLLLMVAWRMADVRHVVHVLRTAPRSDIGVLATCFSLTVVFDMVVGVLAGMVLASLLFLRRMAELTGVRLVRDDHPELRQAIPAGVAVYEIDGPLFFGAAERALHALRATLRETSVLVLDLDGVPTIDATGLVNLESILRELRVGRRRVVLTGLQPPVAELLRRAGLTADGTLLHERATLREGIEFAAELAGTAPQRAPQDPAPIA